VIDNGGNKSIGDLIARFKQVILTYEPFPTPGAARNKGISIAKGGILAFTDSDCIPASDWIEKGVKHMIETDNCGLVGGRIDLFYKNKNRLTLVELYEKEFAFRQRDYIKNARFSATANAFIAKEVINTIGVFEPSLIASEDKDIGLRIFSAGFKQIYADDAVVGHPARHSFADLYKKVTETVFGLFDLEKKRSRTLVNRLIKREKHVILLYLKNLYEVIFSEAIKGLEYKLKLTIVCLFAQSVALYGIIRLKFGYKLNERR
jgi:GT2 family glycosyltransferase